MSFWVWMSYLQEYFQADREKSIASLQRLEEDLSGGAPTQTFHVPPTAPQNVCDRTFINISQIQPKAALAPADNWLGKLRSD